MSESATYVPKGIAFSPTFECPGMCSHCNIRFDRIDLTARLSVEVGKRVLREGKEVGLNSFQLVGGEPTLYEDFFIEAFKEGRRLSMKCHRPPTNCWLGGDEKRLRRLFSLLKDAGFSAGFRISLDHFHRRVPVENVARFIAVAGEYFSLKPFVIGCCDIREARSVELLEKLASLLTDAGLKSNLSDSWLETEKGKIRIGHWAPTRPTWKPLPDEEFIFHEVKKEIKSQDRFRRTAPISIYGCLGHEGVGYLWVEPDGNVRLCCGNAVNFIDALIMGNIHNDSLSGILERASESPLISTLASGGPVAVAVEAGAEHFLSSRYTHRCELCYRLLTDQSILKFYGHLSFSLPI